jgi:hypothetical protein
LILCKKDCLNGQLRWMKIAIGDNDELNDEGTITLCKYHEQNSRNDLCLTSVPRRHGSQRLIAQSYGKQKHRTYYLVRCFFWFVSYFCASTNATNAFACFSR